MKLPSGSEEVESLCPFLSAAELNYVFGNCKLWDLKLAFEEWRHWLEGARFPVVVYMDHKHLFYIESAKRLNTRQPRWALFFSRFVISFRPGSKNLKTDALTRSFLLLHVETPAPYPFIPPKNIIAGLTQDISDLLLQAQSQAPRPAQLLFVPKNLTTAVSQSVMTVAWLVIHVSLRCVEPCPDPSGRPAMW